jgi:hypothetical protein
MKTATAKLHSVSPYSQSRHYTVDKANNGKEGPKDYEARTWRERLHVNDKGNVFIPPMAFKNCIAEVAKFLQRQIPGKGKSTYTKHFEAGVIVPEGLELPVKKADVPGEWLFLPSDGKRGSGKRVDKCYPVIREWSGEVSFLILDETITEDVFKEHLEEAGRFIGIGRFRPRNNGYYGRFKVEAVKWA